MEGRFFSRDSFAQSSLLDRAVEKSDFAAAVVTWSEVPMHDPPLEPRDEAVFLLTAAAEVEHALMVQYLYAAYSVRVPDDDDPNFQQLKTLQDLLLQIAKEEMGHLITVQNLLHLIGGPLNFGREHSPYASEIYPFRFKLQPLTLDSLAKYVIAESPSELPPDLPEDDKALLQQICQDAIRSNDGLEVRHVGPIFKRLEYLFQDGNIKDEDIRLDTCELQAKFEDWGFEPGTAEAGEPLIIESFESADVGQVRTAAITAVKKIGEQGEGFDLPPAGQGQSESHFERFFDIYKRFRELSTAGVLITWPVAENANTTVAPPEAPDLMHMVEMVQEAHASKGRITHPRARAWAQLCNLRYRMLLGHLSHFMRLDQELYSASYGLQQGDRTTRGLLLIWTFNEMRRLKKIATKLVQLPKDDPPGEFHAGPPFELPYTLNLPDREEDRWRVHLDTSRAAVRLIRERLVDEGDEFLDDLVRLDEEAQVIMQSLAAGSGVPEESLPTDFQKAVLILEEAVRGFNIGQHGNFWGDKPRNDFLETSVFGTPLLQKKLDGTFNFDPDTSPLVQRLEGTVPPPANRMPRFRPPVPTERIGFIRQWITGECQDNDPPGQPGIKRERNPKQESLDPPPPPPPRPLSFAAHIKNLFRESDRLSMLSKFDLHRYEDVRDHAASIVERLEKGDMPCDGSWPPDRIATFRNWIEDGKLP